MRRGRRHDIFDQPWIPIAAVVGVIAVIAIAVFFFMGSGGGGGDVATQTSPQATSAGSSPATAGSGSTRIDTSKIKELPTVTVPVTGTFVKVGYIGSFSGSYGLEGAMMTARDSGERVYEITNATSMISASFKKTDTSTKPHELTVEIWKDGRVVKFDKTTAPSGEVSVSWTP